MHTPRAVALLLVVVLLGLARAVPSAENPPPTLAPYLAESGIATAREAQFVERWAGTMTSGKAGPAASDAWFDDWLSAGLPFSFRYRGVPWNPVTDHWTLTRSEPVSAAGEQRQELCWTEPGGGLTMSWHVRRFLQEAAVEWLVTFSNRGKSNTGLVDDVEVVDLRMSHRQPGKNFMVHGANGGRCLPDDLMAFSLPVPDHAKVATPVLHLLRQDFGRLETDMSMLNSPLVIGSRHFQHGLGTHAVSRIRVDSPEPIERLAAWIGVDSNERTRVGGGSVVFAVRADQTEVLRSPVLHGGNNAVRVDVETKGARVLELDVDDAGDGPACDHADWADAVVTLRGGKTIRLEDLPRAPANVIELGSQFSSSNEHLPLFGVETPESRGMLFALGWTGQWRAQFTRDGNQLSVRAGLRTTHFRVRPGDTLRGPRVLAVAWEGPRLHGQNVLRRLLRDHYLPHLPGGKPHEPLVSVNLCFTHHGKGGYLEQPTEKQVLALLRPCQDLGVEAFVIDAGWYPCKQWGDIFRDRNFSTDMHKYPRGFRPLSEAFGKAGMAFGLWFPPEALGSFDDPSVRDRFVGIVGGYVKNQGITMYRQDAGILPSENDPEGQGVAEMKHIAGLYAMQDRLRREFPALLMEGCCGGGRRIDLESLSRFVWHQKSDRWFETLSDHCGLQGANLFLPGGIINVPTEAVDNFGLWSSFGGQLCLAWHPLDNDFPMEKGRRQVALYKRVRGYLSGDFYPLSVCTLQTPWLAYQFHRRDQDSGFALVFKRSSGGGDVFKLAPKGLKPALKYRLELQSTGKTITCTADELARGIELRLPATPDAELAIYRAEP